MNKLIRLSLLITLGISVVNLSGCVLFVAGATAGGAKVVSDRRTIGSQTEDATIELKASTRISKTFGDAVHVDVTSYNRKVLLTGEVKDEAARMQVEDEVKSIENVESVVNEIQVSLFLSSFSSRSSDAVITTKVRGALLGAADIYSNSFKVVTEAGVVYLMGRVSQREGDIAAEAVREIAGVKKVVKVFEYIDESEVRQRTEDREQKTGS
jgi:osmotically-inducible protein OsmY